MLIFLRGKRRALHVPAVLSLASGPIILLTVASILENASWRGGLKAMLALGFAFFTLAQYRLLSAHAGSLCVRSALGKRCLPTERLALGILESRSNHGLPVFVVHAEADGRRLTLTDSVSRARAERHLRGVQERILDGHAAAHTLPGPQSTPPATTTPSGSLGARPLGGGRTWMIACAVGLLLAVLMKAVRWFTSG